MRAWPTRATRSSREKARVRLFSRSHASPVGHPHREAEDEAEADEEPGSRRTGAHVRSPLTLQSYGRPASLARAARRRHPPALRNRARKIVSWPGARRRPCRTPRPTALTCRPRLLADGASTASDSDSAQGPCFVLDLLRGWGASNRHAAPADVLDGTAQLDGRLSRRCRPPRVPCPAHPPTTGTTSTATAARRSGHLGPSVCADARWQRRLGPWQLVEQGLADDRRGHDGRDGRGGRQAERGVRDHRGGSRSAVRAAPAHGLRPTSRSARPATCCARPGTSDLADALQDELVGRNVLAGRWTFQVVEEFDDGYYFRFKRLERRVRDELMQGRRHVFEAEMKSDRRSGGRAGHEATPDDVD